jgi:hypothetical protein
MLRVNRYEHKRSRALCVGIHHQTYDDKHMRCCGPTYLRHHRHVDLKISLYMLTGYDEVKPLLKHAITS